MARRDPSRLIWGYFVAGLFLFFLGLPILFGTMMGECFGDPADCRNKQIHVVATLIAVPVIALVLFWLTNFLVARWRGKNKP